MKTSKLLCGALVLFASTFLGLPVLAQSNATVTVVKHVKADEAAKLVAKGGVTVLDVRTPKEFAAGHIAGATNIDFNGGDFAKKLEKLDREKTYLVHCAVGGRSTKSLPDFQKLGFKQVIHLDGGMKTWEAAKGPVVKD
jgi:rhodanese-related sulfurtransferase